MRNRMGCMRLAGTGVLVGLIVAGRVSAQPAPQEMQNRLVLTEEEAIAVMPAELVAGPTVSQLAVSSSHQYVLAVRNSMRLTAETIRNASAGHVPPPGEVAIVLWDAKSHEARTVWKAGADAQVYQIQFLTGSDTALAMVSTHSPVDIKNPMAGMKTRTEVLRITGATERATAIAQSQPDTADSIQVFFSPTEPLALLSRAQVVEHTTPKPNAPAEKRFEMEHSLYVIRQDGRLGPAAAFPRETNMVAPAFDSSGNPFVTVFTRNGKNMSHANFGIDPRNGALKPLPEKVNTYVEKPRDPLSVAGFPVRLKPALAKAEQEGASRTFGVLWLEGSTKSEKPRALVSTEITDARLLSKTESLLYVSQGALWSAPLVRFSKAEYVAMKQAAERAVALSNAKQLALGLLMYAQDNDEMYPGQEGVQGKIAPYLKNDALFNGFSYTYQGGSLASIENPAETELGFVNGPGGRAILYADGHAKWKNN